MVSYKQEPIFDLIKSMTKAEKRNFKLYATRLSGNQDAKFLLLFDALDTMEYYEESRVLKKCPIKKEQLPNMKAHLYKQILISIRLLNVQHKITMQLREQLDFARILYDKGLYRQSLKLLEKTKDTALHYQQHTMALEAIDSIKIIKSLYVSQNIADNIEAVTKQSTELCQIVASINNLSHMSLQLYGLHQKLGYVRSERDLTMVNNYFKPRLDKYVESELSFNEKFYYFQSQVWYNYIQHDFLMCYKYTRKWIMLFDNNPHMKELMYDNYIRGYARLLDGVFLMRSHKRFVENLQKLQHERDNFEDSDDNILIITDIILYYNKVKLYYMEGNFAEGVKIIPEIEAFIKKYYNYIDLHKRMLFYYKIACMYFGNADYNKCIEYLKRIIDTRDPQIRRDLQCYSRILMLISHYELGQDRNLDYQIKSLYAYLVKMNDMHKVQYELVSFLKRLGTIYNADFKNELIKLYEQLKPLEQHPYERRTFFYLDINSWLESKIKEVSVAKVIHDRFCAENGIKE